ncbi:unnamed protein product [Owenia fusiformis]|uniref:Uncharacterized protein n=1 Tax=Owenia fusiformis TaxID=6347 RepID=A0A8J1U1T0_OWEFU|nr:unnamed protein product [Owenia fusiformis]
MANFGNDVVTLSEDSKKYLKEQLLKYSDTNKDGVISKDEIWDCLNYIGINIDDEKSMDVVMELFDTNEDGDLSVDEIVNQWEELQVHSLRSEELMTCFEKLDKNGDGFIRLPELRAVLTKKGRNQFSGTEAAEIIQELKLKFDKNNDGKFSYPEFVQMYADTEFHFKPKEKKNETLPDAKVSMED